MIRNSILATLVFLYTKPALAFSCPATKPDVGRFRIDKIEKAYLPCFEEKTKKPLKAEAYGCIIELSRVSESKEQSPFTAKVYAFSDPCYMTPGTILKAEIEKPCCHPLGGDEYECRIRNKPEIIGRLPSRQTAYACAIGIRMLIIPTAIKPMEL